MKFESISCVEGVATAKSNIACAKSTNKGQRNNEELLRALQEDYDLVSPSMAKILNIQFNRLQNMLFNSRTVTVGMRE